MTTREVRLVLAQRPSRRDHLHGAWWPHTTVIDDELGPMLEVVNTRFASVHGVTLNRDEWPDADPTGKHARLGRTKISWYGLAEAHQMVLFCSQGRRLALLILPPDTPEAVALTATLMACAPGNVLRTDETLARAATEAPAMPTDDAWNPFAGASRQPPPSDSGWYRRS